ncbi:hypothetical protein MMC18_000719 [Xylographa bjoerkii]|nr:hypothetical protein [Xylographa bjoerkii]
MDFMMARHHREILNNSRCQTDILDTFRVLVEEGNSDPMATNVAGDSALHLCTGSWDDFHYLLNQDHCHVDLIQLSHEGVSLAQHHANWAWPTSSRIADFAYEQERLLEEQFYSSQSPWTPSKHDKISMLHGAVRFMRGQYDGTQSSVIYAIKLIKRLIMDGVDLHEIDNLWGGVVEGTAIDIITRSMINPPTEENIRLAEAKIIPYLKLWLETLRDANVDVKKYLQEEKILAAQKLERDLWGTTEFDWPCRTDWHVSLNEDEQEYMISVKYVVRERAKPMIDFNTPGAWVEDD